MAAQVLKAIGVQQNTTATFHSPLVAQSYHIVQLEKKGCS